MVRPVEDPVRIAWFQGEGRLAKHMGRLWEDIGRVRVVNVGGKIDVARIETSCAVMQRGDRLVFFEPRPAPPLPSKQGGNNLSIGRVVSSKGFRQVLGAGCIAYVNLGTRRGVRVGDHLSFFRYPAFGGMVVSGNQDTVGGLRGLGSSPAGSRRGQLPPEILGEGLVLRVSSTAATVFITSSRSAIDLGDYAALE